jgi:plastocyanin
MPRNAPNLKYGVPLFLVVFVVSALALYGGAELVGNGGSSASAEGGPGDTGGGGAGGPVSARIVAKDLQYNPRTIRAAPGAEVNVTLDNQDPGVLHNIAFYTNNRATDKIFGSELVPGPRVENFRFTAPSSPGAYFFRCDVHPDTMNGTFAVR